MSPWSVQQAESLYLIDRWGKGVFSVNERGNVQVHAGEKRCIDLKALCDDLAGQNLHAPLLIRFSDILRGRMQRLHDGFANACREAGYQGHYRGVYPIKVNQQCQVVEEIVEFGGDLHWGLEAGSKPELHIAMAMLEGGDEMLICNGYKDAEFIHLALLGRKMGKSVFIVIEKPGELDLALRVAAEIGVEPLIGLRCRLAASGKGKWMESGGDASKFGLSPQEIVAAVGKLAQAGKLDCLRLLHFHIGSQVPHIRQIKQAMREIGQFFVALRRLGAPIDHIDVGGGLGVDYDGSLSGSDSSVDYSISEYANDIVWSLRDICEEYDLPHPNIISESGRALVAHHAVLVVNVLDVMRRANGSAPIEVEEQAPLPLHQLVEALSDCEAGSFREALHDAQALREDIHRLFSLGHCSLTDRALADECYWRIIDRVARAAVDDEQLAEALEPLRPVMADRYFCNLSVFQSLPDSWAIGQVFPVCPIHRLDEEPTRQGVLVDITCDSDGKLDHFPGDMGIQPTLPLHEPRAGESYFLGIFLVGAYQEILGDLHNLFGDTHAVHVRLDGDSYELEQVVEGESVAEVLDYVQYHEKVLVDRMRRQVQAAKSGGRLTLREANDLLKIYQEGLRGYTYLE